MEYIQGLPTQTSLFLFSLGFGFLLGILYDVFRTLRMIIGGSEKLIFAADLLYFLICGVLSFFFILVTDEGRLRFYTVLGEMLGWMIYYFSFGTVAMKLSASAVKLMKRLSAFVFKPINFLFRKIISFIKKIAKFFKKRIRKNNKKSKFNLQKQKSIVYNLYSYFYNYNFLKIKENDMAAAKIKQRKRSIILAVLLCALVCYFVATLISIQSKVKAQQNINNELAQSYQQQLDENAELEDRIANGEESENIERIAREQYGYADPDERVYYDSTD